MSHPDFVRQLHGSQGFSDALPWLWRWHLDLTLIGLLLLLSVVGLLVLYSASGQDMHMVTRQAIYLLIGFVGMLGVAQIPPQRLRQWSLGLYLTSLSLLIMVLVHGIESKGAQRWIQLPGLRFQPAEITKLTIPIFMAGYLAKQSLPPTFKVVVIALIMLALPVLLIAKQPDLGTALLVSASGMIVLLLVGLRKRLILSAILLAVPTLYLLWRYFMYDYQKQRVLTFLNPASDPWGAGWNIIQSTIAIGSGGLYGKGWMQGTQSHLEFLPESDTDFIIAVFAEEFGLLGCLLLLIPYTLIIGRGLFIALNAQTLFSRLLAGSITLTFFVYIFVNIGMVSGLLPVVGVPLPLVSRGGTSLITLMVGFGMLMSVHTDQRALWTRC